VSSPFPGSYLDRIATGYIHNHPGDFPEKLRAQNTAVGKPQNFSRKLSEGVFGAVGIAWNFSIWAV
jgi:hypothetical protein